MKDLLQNVRKILDTTSKSVASDGANKSSHTFRSTSWHVACIGIPRLIRTQSVCGDPKKRFFLLDWESYADKVSDQLVGNIGVHAHKM
jgi:hypothetical protein